MLGRYIKKYKAGTIEKYLIDSHNGYDITARINIDDYPAIKEYLDQFYFEISARQDQGATPYNLRSCAYYPEFSKEKIAFPGVNRKWQFILVERSVYISNPMRFITADKGLEYIKAILESHVIKSYWKMTANMQDDNGYQMDSYMIEKIPIPKIPECERKKYIEASQKLNSVSDCSPEKTILLSELNQLIYQLYELEKTEIQLIEAILNERNSSCKT